MGDIKWLVLLASQQPGIVPCELDKLGKLARKARRTPIGQDVRVRAQIQTAGVEEERACLHQHDRIRKFRVTAELGLETSQHSQAII